MSLFGGCGTRTSLRASPLRSSIASGSSAGVCARVRACVKFRARSCACTQPVARTRGRVAVCGPGIRNRVARGTDSTSSIGAPNEEEDRIDSPVT